MPQSSALPAYSAIYAFGDSLSDAGNISITTTAAGATQPVSPPYLKQQYGPIAANVFSNGPTWVQDLSIALGLGTLAPSLAAGTDFAYGRAETGSTPSNASDLTTQAISLPAQLKQFQARVPNPSANALYTLSIGSNDLLGILANPGLTADQQATDVNASVANEIGFVRQLIAGGAKNLVVMNVPDLGKSPDVTQGLANGSNTPSAALVAEASQLSSQYDTALGSQLANLATTSGARIQVVDSYGLIDNAVANPAAYGLSNVTAPVWSGNYTSAASGTLAATAPATQDQYLFWDHLHPTETGHQALAGAAEELLSGALPLTVTDATTGQSIQALGYPYTGPSAGLQQEYINVTPDRLNITASTPNWFIYGGAGGGAMTVSSGTNVLDGTTGSWVFTGGSGVDTFSLDDRAAPAAIASTIVNFHAGDTATIWGVASSDFTLSWQDGQGSAGYTGLTLHATSPNTPAASLTLAGLSSAALSNGQLGVAAGTSSGIPYLAIHANA
jgi:phospholipase/lecithinase/hemolysin